MLLIAAQLAPRFFPTYKKMPGRGPVDVRDADWVSKVYITAYKEPFYKGGRVQEREAELAWLDESLKRIEVLAGR